MKINSNLSQFRFGQRPAWGRAAVLSTAMALGTLSGCGPNLGTPEKPKLIGAFPSNTRYILSGDDAPTYLSWDKENQRFLLLRGMSYTSARILSEGQYVDGVKIHQEKKVLVLPNGNLIDGPTGKEYKPNGEPVEDFKIVREKDEITLTQPAAE